MRRFFVWWFRELSGLVPQSVVRVFGLSLDTLIISDEGDGFTPHYEGKCTLDPTRSQEKLNAVDLPEEAREFLRGIDPERVRVELKISRSLALSRLVRVPRAAENELDGVLSFEVERHTPYRADEVYYTHAIDRGQSDDETLAVNLTLVPREFVETVFDSLRRIGFVLDRISVAPPAAAAAGDPIILDGDRSEAEGGAQSGRLPAFAAVVLFLAAAAVATPLAGLDATAEAQRSEIAVARAKAVETAARTRNAGDIQSALLDIAKAKTDTPLAIEILNTLSAVLPDGPGCGR